MEADEDLIRCVLQPCIRLVQLPGSLARQLAELVAIGHVRECPKNQIRTHNGESPSRAVLRCYLAPSVQLLAKYKVELLPQTACPPFRRTKWVPSSKNFSPMRCRGRIRQLALYGIEVTTPGAFAPVILPLTPCTNAPCQRKQQPGPKLRLEKQKRASALCNLPLRMAIMNV